eukprot:CAMPEP_0114979708 /NCGR_PEP_ID=MMETSP0216-20121206/4535_1 /TAXON_ID=223996 /ORGANISM="Protocruzia adherens, Strain Boccale" /LENGTH=268 /DNA_ID=CAMNT_0002341091 /DNA_START=376 /DNA_END=1179 /DNA_ORIENTATION=-
MADIEKILVNDASVCSDRKLFTREQNLDRDLETVETLKPGLKIRIKTPFLLIAEWIDLCYQQELSPFWNDLQQGETGGERTMNHSLSRLNSTFDSIAAIMAVEIICIMSNNSKTTVEQVKKSVLKILQMFSDLFDNLVHQFQVLLQEFALDVSPQVTYKRIEKEKNSQWYLWRAFSAFQCIHHPDRGNLPPNRVSFQQDQKLWKRFEGLLQKTLKDISLGILNIGHATTLGEHEQTQDPILLSLTSPLLAFSMLSPEESWETPSTSLW